MKFPSPKFYKGQWYIGHNIWEVFIERGDFLGHCDPNKKEITLSPDQSKYSMASVFIHEVIHAIEAEYDFNITRKGSRVKYSHQPVMALEQGFLDFVIWNQQRLCAFLLDDISLLDDA